MKYRIYLLLVFVMICLQPVSMTAQSVILVAKPVVSGELSPSDVLTLHQLMKKAVLEHCQLQCSPDPPPALSGMLAAYSRTHAFSPNERQQLINASGARFMLFTEADLSFSKSEASLGLTLSMYDLKSGYEPMSFTYQTGLRGSLELAGAKTSLFEDLDQQVADMVCESLGGSTLPEEVPSDPKDPYSKATAGTSLEEEARKFASLLNQVRQNPASHSNTYGVNLSYLPARPALQWNDILAKVAVQKARDMYERQYFDHVDPDGNGINILIHEAGYTLVPLQLRSPRSANTFESISAGYTTAEEILSQLIIDEGVNPPGHRHHLLGEGDFWGTCTDIGVGIIKTDDRYGGYGVIIIAKHDW